MKKENKTHPHRTLTPPQRQVPPQKRREGKKKETQNEANAYDRENRAHWVGTLEKKTCEQNKYEEARDVPRELELKNFFVFSEQISFWFWGSVGRILVEAKKREPDSERKLKLMDS